MSMKRDCKKQTKKNRFSHQGLLLFDKTRSPGWHRVTSHSRFSLALGIPLGQELLEKEALSAPCSLHPFSPHPTVLSVPHWAASQCRALHWALDKVVSSHLCTTAHSIWYIVAAHWLLNVIWMKTHEQKVSWSKVQWVEERNRMLCLQVRSMDSGVAQQCELPAWDTAGNVTPRHFSLYPTISDKFLLLFPLPCQCFSHQNPWFPTFS